jgi:hypothetical protein
LSAAAASDEGAQQGIHFAQSFVQAALGSYAVGGDQSGENAEFDVLLDGPETRLGMVRKRKFADREVLRVQRDG